MQFAADSLADFDRLVALDDRLIEELGRVRLLNLAVEIPVDVHQVLATRYRAHKKNIGSAGSLCTFWALPSEKSGTDWPIPLNPHHAQPDALVDRESIWHTDEKVFKAKIL